MTDFLLLAAFRDLFEGKVYNPRPSTQGDYVASHLFEDLYRLARSQKFVQRVDARAVVVNTGNTIQGKRGRRGDGTLGERVPSEAARSVDGFHVSRGPVARLQIGSEAKTLATAMLRQIDRVMNDLRGQARTFARHSREAVKVAIVGVNHADEFTSVQGEHAFIARTPPSREADEVLRRLHETVEPRFDEMIILPYLATNRPPYRFSWIDERTTQGNYAAALIRLSAEYERRF